MPDLLIRNLPAELHARLKAAAAAHRRSVNQETIATLEKSLTPGIPLQRVLPEPIPLKGTLTSVEETQRLIDQDIAERGY
ncbi:MAG TPA: Arc family DNA-binding protein [Verrucomicrobiales bacterium]|nr:Arc family DNA-binding protein [Verrucomicrobiales bacterium]